jgi:hypothetical protein
MTDQKLSACKRCYAVRYCSRECQATAWPLHKTEVCDVVQSWIAGVTLQGFAHLGGCSAAEIATARGQYPACTNIIFMTFHKFSAPDGRIAIARYHLHTKGSPPCTEKGAVQCCVVRTGAGHATAMPAISLGQCPK